MDIMAFLTHPWQPFYDRQSRVLILGTFPSPRSREMGFYYGHPQNIFWKTVAAVLKVAEPPRDVPSRRAFLLDTHIALWDVLHSCDIKGASDASIRHPLPNRFAPILNDSAIRAIFTTGKTATELFNRLCAKEAGMEAIYLPSTSPANRAVQVRPEFTRQWTQLAAVLTT
jgi:hypoxanthine-DNA glycosylase